MPDDRHPVSRKDHGLPVRYDQLVLPVDGPDQPVFRPQLSDAFSHGGSHQAHLDFHDLSPALTDGGDEEARVLHVELDHLAHQEGAAHGPNVYLLELRQVPAVVYQGDDVARAELFREARYLEVDVVPAGDGYDEVRVLHARLGEGDDARCVPGQRFFHLPEGFLQEIEPFPLDVHQRDGPGLSHAGEDFPGRPSRAGNQNFHGASSPLFLVSIVPQKGRTKIWQDGSGEKLFLPWVL